METLQTLGIALGLASLAGLNLYLTVFVTGLAIQQQWIDISQTHPDLLLLGHPAILGVAGVLYFIQFFADKVPWVDSLWDVVHTIIRPIGGAFLAIRVLGTPDPVFDVLVALLGGSAAMLTHSVKSGTRLVVNHSPEPFSNIALSLGEDTVVLGGLALIHQNAALAFGVFFTVLVVLVYLMPRVYRAAKVQVWLLWKKIGFPSSDKPGHALDAHLPPDLNLLFHNHNLLGEKILWAARCVAQTAPKVPRNVFGYLIATEEEPGKVWFVAHSHWRRKAVNFDLTSYQILHEPRFLSENIVLYSLEKKPRFLFIFDRTQARVAHAVAASLKERLSTSPVPTPLPAVEPADLVRPDAASL